MPTFSEYADACRLHGHKVVPIYNLNRLPDRGRLIWLCNPNNPTGEVREKEVLTACIKQNPQRIFVMDQSYEFFTQKALLTAREAGGITECYPVAFHDKTFCRARLAFRIYHCM